MSPQEMDARNLHGLRVLVVEDDPLVAEALAEILPELRCTVSGIARTLLEALALAAFADCDVALLDINIHGKPVFPVADVLAVRGIPFVFTTGALPEAATQQLGEYPAAPLLQKPWTPGALSYSLSRAVSGTSAGSNTTPDHPDPEFG